MDDLGDVIDVTLRKQARENELTIAWVRFFALLAITAQQWSSWLWPESSGAQTWPISAPILCSAWALGNLVFACVMQRGHFHPLVGIIAPFTDALLLHSIYDVVRTALGAPRFLQLGGLTNVGLSAALLTVTSALRLCRRAVVSSTSLGILLFIVHSLRCATWSQEMVRGITLLLATGFFAMWMTRIVRRVAGAEIGRQTLRRFLPDHVVDAAYEDPTRLAAEATSTEATIVFSDLRGFTSLAERLDPRAAFELLNEVQGALATAVRAHGGIVDKFIGDGLLAVFEGTADHAAHGLAAALAMRDAIRALNRRRGGTPLAIGIGVHSGRVVAGCLGNGRRLEYTVIGDTVNTAARLEALTKELSAEIIASEETVRAAPRELRLLAGESFEAAGPVQLRGKQKGLQVYVLRADQLVMHRYFLRARPA
jgi:class 3 adenylate cyclase